MSATTSKVELGKLVPPDMRQVRDAVHVAVVAVQASTGLRPGEWVGLNDEGLAVVVDDGRALGVVDPFLHCSMVRTSEWFYLFLKPGIVSSLQHVWAPDICDMTTPNPSLGIDDAALEAARQEVEAERAERAAAWAQADGKARACRAELRYALDHRDGYGGFSNTAIIQIASELVVALDEVDRVEGGAP